MSTDPFEQLQQLADPLAPPEARFVARLRQRIADALTELPTVDLPERSTTVSTTPIATSTITPYICVSPAIEALAWYRDALGAVETIRYTGDDGRIGHAEVLIAGANVMLSDEYPELEVVSPTTLGGTPMTLHVEVPDVDAVYERVVAAGARVPAPPQDEAYGARSFTMIDPFGHRWMIQTPSGQMQDHVEGYTITRAE
jgi:PhnB protein